MVVERLHIEIAVDVQLAIVRDGVTQTSTISQFRTTHPVVGGIIRRVRGHPVEDRQFVQRQLVGSRKRLAIVQRTTEVFDALPYGVLPRLIVFWIEVLVDRQVAQGLFDLSLSARLEVHVQVFGQVPAHGETTVPQELRIEGDRQTRASQILHVTFLQLIVVT